MIPFRFVSLLLQECNQELMFLWLYRVALGEEFLLSSHTAQQPAFRLESLKHYHTLFH